MLVSGTSEALEDTDICNKKYLYDLAIYLMTLLSSLYGIIMYRAINAPGHRKNVVDVINGTEKRKNGTYW